MKRRLKNALLAALLMTGLVGLVAVMAIMAHYPESFAAIAIGFAAAAGWLYDPKDDDK